jgi:hypothetical protein
MAQEKSYLEEALAKFPNTTSNYEAMTNLASSVQKKLSKMSNVHSQEYFDLRNKYFAIRNERDSSPVIISKAV